jgi:hypothetical protein
VTPRFAVMTRVEALKQIDNGSWGLQRWCKATVRRAFTGDRMNRYEVEFRDGSRAVLFGDEIREEENR